MKKIVLFLKNIKLKFMLNTLNNEQKNDVHKFIDDLKNNNIDGNPEYEDFLEWKVLNNK